MVELFAYEKLNVWQDAITLVKDVHLTAQKFTKSELYALTSQLKRATLSVSLNIAEGKGRNSDRDFLKFLYIARGSAYEVSTCFKVALDLEYIQFDEYNKLKSSIRAIEKQLNGLINSIMG